MISGNLYSYCFRLSVKVVPTISAYASSHAFMQPSSLCQHTHAHTGSSDHRFARGKVQEVFGAQSYALLPYNQVGTPQ